MSETGRREHLSEALPQEGKWYFYNPTAFQTDLPTFQKIRAAENLKTTGSFSDKTIIAFQTTTGEDTVVTEAR